MECKAGDKVVTCAVYFEAAKAFVYLREVEFVLPADGIVRGEDGVVRTLYYAEAIFQTQQEAREAAAATIRKAAESLMRQADELAEPRVVTV